MLPELLRTEKLSLNQGGTLLLGAYFGFVLATLLTGFLSDRVGNRIVLFLAGLLLAFGLFGVSLNVSYVFLILMMGCIGVGLGAIEVGANGLIVDLHREKAGRYLNLLASFHGTGSFLVPLYVGYLIDLGVTWQRVYLSVVLLAGLLAAAFALSPRAVAVASKREASWNWRKTLRIGFQGEMGWYYLLIGTYVAVELGHAAWLMEYLQQVRGMSVTRSSYYLSGFFVMIMLGRFFGSFIVERLGYMRVVGWALLGGALCLIVGIGGGEHWVLALSLSGLFFSIVFPTVTAVVTGFHKENVGTVLGILFTFGGIGGAIGPWSIGWVSQRFGLQTGMYMTVGYCLVSFATLVIVNVRQKRLTSDSAR